MKIKKWFTTVSFPYFFTHKENKVDISKIKISESGEVVLRTKGVTIELERAKVLLKACYDLLQKQEESHYVLNLLETTVHYDEADCDGYCLKNDIEAELEL